MLLTDLVRRLDGLATENDEPAPLPVRRVREDPHLEGVAGPGLRREA
ncbi:hypothetical protein ACFVFI_34390 [Streptomyces sp. NPDC057705]